MAVANLTTQQTILSEVRRLDRNRRALRIWLGIVLLALVCLVLVGGATRLTNSGLSITEWKPIHGVIPPLTAAEWEEEFKLYQRIPEFQQLNSDMTVEDFKTIFWCGMGAPADCPRDRRHLRLCRLSFSGCTGMVERRLRWPLAGILALGGLQGFIGWWMVSSGLSVRTDVSQYRLAAHLVMACLIFAACMWIMRGLSPHSNDTAPTESSRHGRR